MIFILNERKGSVISQFALPENLVSSTQQEHSRKVMLAFTCHSTKIKHTPIWSSQPSSFPPHRTVLA